MRAFFAKIRSSKSAMNLVVQHEFKQKEFRKTSLVEKVFSHCLFEHCFFQESDFCKVQFSDCIFKNCNLHLVKLEGCRLQDVLFLESKIVGGEFFKCEKTFFSPRFEKCVLMGCNFSDLKMKRMNFRRSKIQECSFSNSLLAEADFREADLEGSLFHHTDLTKADFRDAKNYSIDPTANGVKKAHFSSPEALSLLKFSDILIT